MSFIYDYLIGLTLSWRRSLSYRNQSTDLQSKEVYTGRIYSFAKWLYKFISLFSHLLFSLKIDRRSRKRLKTRFFVCLLTFYLFDSKDHPKCLTSEFWMLLQQVELYNFSFNYLLIK